MTDETPSAPDPRAPAQLPPPGQLGLPMGRWVVTPDELDHFTTFGDQAHRRALLVEWQRLTEGVRSAVDSIAACWIGGSFLSTKDAPADIDCVYIVHNDALNKAKQDPDKATFLQAAVAHGARENLGLRVDTYFLPWWPRAGYFRGSEERQKSYLQERGYWDDLWTRCRNGSNIAFQKVPRRGYLEVILDGYS